MAVGDLINKFIEKALFIDFVKGLMLTLKYGVSKGITMQYPDKEKWIPFRRWRGRHTLNFDKAGRELCVACELCAKSCPTKCITVIPMEDDTGRGISDRVARVWKIDLVRCLYCGLCEDACPTRALRLGREYELSCTSLSCAVMNKEELLRPESVPETLDGGVVAAAKLVKTETGVIVVPDLGRTKKRNL